MRNQRTIKKEVQFRGVGLHTGRETSVTLKPAPSNTGVVFYRVDRDTVIKAGLGNVVDTAFATTLGYNGTRIKTVEHLLSVLAGLGIDNILIEIDGPEIPILDGSSSPLVDVVLEAGILKQGSKKPYIKIKRPFHFKDGKAEITALPFDGRRISYRIFFKHSHFGLQDISLELDEETYVKEIAPARTFGFLKNVETLRANGLAKGGSLDNAVVIDENGILNEEGLRFDNEFVRHKVLDLIGDFSLIGYPIYGHIIAEKAGHSSHIRFLRKLLSCVNVWEFVSTEPELTRQLALV
ncbi:MAG: UDP-3-O-acyl-N-acetylglucosamine deacetylase [Nitrospirae bacterium]|nr:MAG: UDP-3-O-acyl-N-acetylglucosamine deacetylase [Nitrospirota bacterium]